MCEIEKGFAHSFSAVELAIDNSMSFT